MARFVFIVQGEGRGHLSQAVALSEYLEKEGHTVEAVYTGCRNREELPAYYTRRFGPVLQCFGSPFFIRTPNRKGIYVGRTLLFHLAKVPYYLREVRRLRSGIREQKPHVVVNFYDVVGSLAMRKLPRNTLRVGIGHHFLLHLENYPCPKGNPVHRELLRVHTRMVLKGCDRVLALSFREKEGTGKIAVVPPLIREAFRTRRYHAGDRGLVYLLNEGFITDLLDLVRQVPELKLDVFSDLPADTPMPGGITLHPPDADAFLQKMSTCRFLITTAGFDTVAEAASMGIPIACIPSGNHYEQHCNSLDAERSGLGLAVSSIGPDLIGNLTKPRNPDYAGWAQRAEELFLEKLVKYYPWSGHRLE